MSLKAAVISLAVVIAVVGGILIAVLVNMHNANLEADYRSCVTANTGESLDAKAARCYSSIYGE
ncbi:hypothetical protein LXM50_01665 [Microbacterium sp. Au-Mic1]|uniref:hypothetical protein n=1 Tax=Microbacterium sp. Au-Mic1 TaxID=2906457 RepID=UPI001E2E53D2|nr:hypothetical protein [Microbacterium sp. Au-Mic1]MCE4024674.1 hypothetical protein [Microbacterium sp. Au-Mic1]